MAFATLIHCSIWQNMLSLFILLVLPSCLFSSFLLSLLQWAQLVSPGTLFRISIMVSPDASKQHLQTKPSWYTVPFLYVLPVIIISGIHISKMLKSVLQINNELSLLKLDGLPLGSELSRVCNMLAIFLRR